MKLLRGNLLIILTIVMINCQSQETHNRRFLRENFDSEISKQKDLYYAISLTIDVPFELYIDDIPLAKEYSNARKIMGIDLNPYLLKNGNHNLKVILLPNKDGDPTTIRPRDANSSFLKLVSYEKQHEPRMGRAKNYKILKELPLPKVEETLPIIEAQWELEIKDLPYNIKGWSESQDLREIDKEVLEKEVVAYYSKLKKLLNNGNIDEYMELKQKSYEETSILDYIDASTAKRDNSEIKKELEEEAPGNMQPIENFKMFIYGNGRLVTLERIDKKTWVNQLYVL